MRRTPGQNLNPRMAGLPVSTWSLLAAAALLIAGICLLILGSIALGALLLAAAAINGSGGYLRLRAGRRPTD